MGTKLSIDKHVSNLEDILELNTKFLEKIKFDSNIPDCITQHLKIWKFVEDKHPIKKVRSEPINLSTIPTSGFNFLSSECYLVLLIYKKAHEMYDQFINFPHQMWGLVESYSNLTPRGLGSPIAQSESKECFESFLLPQRNDSKKNTYEYMIFAWNGNQANPLVKASALSNAFEVENLLNKGKDPLLEILFSGGVIRNKKLSKGSIVQLSSQAETQPYDQNILDHQQTVRETIYLFNFLFPVPEKKREFSKLADFLQKKSSTNETYQSKFMKYDLPPPAQQPHKVHEPPATTRTSMENKAKVPALNFQQLTSRNPEERVGSPVQKTLPLSLALKIPKIDMNCKNISQDCPSSQRNVDIGMPLVEGVEYSDIAKIPKGSLKLPLPQNQTMKLSLGGLKIHRDEATFEDIELEEQKGFNFDIRDTDRKKLKIQHYAEICSNVIGEYLYVGGEQIAYNREMLKKIGVTHVVNCAGDVCKDKFPNDFKYLTYYLKDSKTENIECVFYEVISFIDEARKGNGKVLIHCVQGVSRSVSLCIAYLIIRENLTYSAAFDIIKKNRGVASPNMGFTVQLLIFQKRLQNSFDSIPVSPRVFAVGRGVSGSQSVVCRMLMEQLYAGKSLKTFDSRGVFIVQSDKQIYLWIGPECSKQDKYIEHALKYLVYLKQYERAPQGQAILQGANNESSEFWREWGIEHPVTICQRVKEWDQWYDEVDEEQFQKEKEFTQQMYSSDRTEEVQQPRTFKPLLFIHPNIDEAITIFDLEDLDHQCLCLLMKESKDNELQVFIWRGNNWNGDDDDERDYVDEALMKHYSHISHENIFVYKQEPNDESEEFLDQFQ